MRCEENTALFYNALFYNSSVGYGKKTKLSADIFEGSVAQQGSRARPSNLLQQRTNSNLCLLFT